MILLWLFTLFFPFPRNARNEAGSAPLIRSPGSNLHPLLEWAFTVNLIATGPGAMARAVCGLAPGAALLLLRVVFSGV